MPPLVIVGHVTTSGKGARQQVLEMMEKIATYAKEKEPGISKYVVTVPQDATDEKSIYVIEEYIDQAALDAHMATPGVASLISQFSSNTTLLYGPAPGKVHNLTPVSAFTKPTILSHSNPYIVFATLLYKPSTAPTGVQWFAKVKTEAEDNEPGTLSYNILTDKDDENLVKTVEAYESEKYLWGPHVASQALKDNLEATKEMRVSRDLVFLKLVSGYFYKSKL